MLKHPVKKLACLLLAVLLLPVPITVSQKVDVNVFDKNDRPVIENTVRLDWEYRTFWTSASNHALVKTDQAGHVFFPAQRYWSCLACEGLNSAFNLFTMGHAGFGSEASIVIYGSEPGSWPCGKNDLLPKQIKLEKSPQTQ